MAEVNCNCLTAFETGLTGLTGFERQLLNGLLDRINGIDGISKNVKDKELLGCLILHPVNPVNPVNPV